MHYRAKRDSIHAESARLLRDMGFSVYDAAHAGNDFPDLVVGACDVTDLLELKTGSAPLTSGQLEFHAKWRGRRVVVLRSVEEVREWGIRQLHERRRALTPVIYTESRTAEVFDGRHTGVTPKGG
jgi:Holliday junction resolvase